MRGAMVGALLGAAAGAGGGGGGTVDTELIVRHRRSGACALGAMSVSAALDLSWEMFEESGDEIRIKRDGVLVATLPDATDVYYPYEVGLVEEADFNRETSSWVFTADLVLVATGETVASRTSAPWVRVYGTCS